MGSIEIGQTHGALTVVKEGPVKRKVKHWWCRCGQCGREELIPSSRLTVMDRCTVCRRGPCVVCGGEILTGRSTACSPVCLKIKTRAKNNRSRAKRLFENPDFYREAYQAVKSDPRQEKLLQERRQRANDRRRGSSDQRRQNAAYYAAHRDAIARRHQHWRETLQPERLLQLRKRRAEYSRDYRRQAELAKLLAAVQTLQEKLDHE